MAIRGRSWIAVLLWFSGLFLAGCSKKQEKVTIAFSNDTMGQIRSCGCIANDMGGLGRRATFVSIVRDTSEKVLLLDGGDFFGTEINYGREKADVSMKSMAIMRYDGVVLGEKDFGFGLDFIRKRAREIGLPILLANVFDSASDSLIFPAKKIVILPGGLKAALIGIIGKRLTFPSQLDMSAVRIGSPETRLRIEVASVRNEVDLIVVLAHMDIGEARMLAGKIGGIDIIICGHNGRAMRKVRKYNGVYILQIPKEGKFMGVASAILGNDGKLKMLDAQISPLSPAYADHEAVIKLFRAYDMDISLKEKSNLPAGILSRQSVKKSFVGAKRCGECHAEIFSSWEATKHAHAFKILEDLSREYDRDCTPCHTTGFYKVGGFVNATTTPSFTNVQCEACHGNGYDHSKETSMKTKSNAVAICQSCHTREHSPDFAFKTYWPQIAH